VMLERPQLLPWWLIHRVLRTRRAGDNPLDATVLSRGNPAGERGAELARSPNQRGNR